MLSSLVALGAPVIAILRTAVALGETCATVQTFWLSRGDPVRGLPQGVQDRAIKSPRLFIAHEDFTSIEPGYRIVSHSCDDREGPLLVNGVKLCLGDNFIFARRSR